MIRPHKNENFITEGDTTIQVEVYSNDYNGGSVVKMELYLDDKLIVENNESSKILTVLENLSPGMHHIVVRSTDDSGKLAVDKTTVFVGPKEVRIGTRESPSDQVDPEPSDASYTEEKSLYSTPIKINFQPQEDYPVPQGYIADCGGKYCDKWNGYTYGWMEGYNPCNGQNVNEIGVWETFGTFENDGNIFSWAIELPRGSYRIKLGLGGKRPGRGMAELKINVEGHLVEDLDGADLLDEHILENVAVLDGQLSLSSIDQSRICFIEIEPLTE
jgi:hypothetical protein